MVHHLRQHRLCSQVCEHREITTSTCLKFIPADFFHSRCLAQIGSLNTAMLTPAGTQAGTTFAVGLENTPLGNVSSFASGTPMYMVCLWIKWYIMMLNIEVC